MTQKLLIRFRCSLHFLFFVGFRLRLSLLGPGNSTLSIFSLYTSYAWCHSVPNRLTPYTTRLNPASTADIMPFLPLISRGPIYPWKMPTCGCLAEIHLITVLTRIVRSLVSSLSPMMNLFTPKEPPHESSNTTWLPTQTIIIGCNPTIASSLINFTMMECKLQLNTTRNRLRMWS